MFPFMISVGAAEGKPCFPGDVTIYLAKEETVVAHSFILSLRSPVLRAQLATGADELHLPDVSNQHYWCCAECAFY